MDRSALRITNLKRRTSAAKRVMNVRIPAPLSDNISRLASEHGASKTEIVLVLLNQGLERAAKLRGGDGRKTR